MERPKRKAINFDLDTNAMRAQGLYPEGYRLLGNSFQKYGFEHRQGSGYVSLNKINSDDIFDIVEKITDENLWLVSCVKKIDVTDIGKQFDLTSTVKGVRFEVKPQSAQQRPLQDNYALAAADDVGDGFSEELIASTMELYKDTFAKEYNAKQVRQVGQVGQAQQVGSKSDGTKPKGGYKSK